MTSKLTAWNRHDYAITRVVLTLAVVALPLFGIGLPVLDWVRGEPYTQEVTVETDAALPAQLAEPRPGAQLDWNGGAVVTLDEPPTSVRVTSLLAASVLIAVVVACLLILLSLVRAAQGGRPFTPRAVRGLWAMGALVLGASVVVPILTGLTQTEVMRAASGTHLGLGAQFSFLWPGVALLLWLLAEVFRMGERLSDDVDGLV